jgi:predicted NUDIX family phosphoesterase
MQKIGLAISLSLAGRTYSSRVPASAVSTSAVGRGAGRELVLVVPRERALAKGSWHGLKLGGVRELLQVIEECGEFRPRSEVEAQPEWQQMIPHLVVRDGTSILTMRRLRAGSEPRLRGQVTLGVGGHINAGDGAPPSAWEAGCRREWGEEVVCDRELLAQAVGLLKDDAGAVGQVHLGVLILVDAASATVEVRERDKLEGRMAHVDQLGVYYLEMETWSQFVYDALLEGSLEGAVDGLPMTLPRSSLDGPAD